MTDTRPEAVLFACGQNCIRSPMAEALTRHLFGQSVYVASCGVFKGEPDPFVSAVMGEMGITVDDIVPKTFEELDDTTFDLIVSLSPEAHEKAREISRTMAVDTEYWPTSDPSRASGSRDQIIDLYRSVRDQILQNVKTRFGPSSHGHI